MDEVRRYKGDEKLKSFLYECPPVEFDVRKIVGMEKPDQNTKNKNKKYPEKIT
jgi:hypothetical protein